MSEHPTHVLREALRAYKNAAYFNDYPVSIYEDALAALRAVEQLEQAARGISFAIWENSPEEAQAAERFRAALAPFDRKEQT